MMKIIGDFSIVSIPANKTISGRVCDSIDDQDIQQDIYYTGIPIITEMIVAKKEGKTEFTAGTTRYVIQSINHPDLNKKKVKQVMLRHTETIHLVTASSFNGITRHCPNCDIHDNESLQFVKAHVQRKTNPKKYIVVSGVLHCENCDYYYMNKSLLLGLPTKIKKDLGVQFSEIKIDEHGRIVRDEWRGAIDSILSRNGYTADGSLKPAERRDVIRYIVDNNLGSYYDIQSHLTWLINTRSKRNPNAAYIWKEDLDWLQSEYSADHTIKGQF